MTQVGEALGLGLAQDLGEDCPFKDESESVSVEDENLAKDDSDAVWKEQANNGGTLGKNLEKGGQAGWGSDGTWNKKYPPSDTIAKEAKSNGKVEISDHAKKGQKRSYDYTVAAHHLIPGEAALHPSHLYEMYMKKGASIDTGEKTYTVKEHIGYNVNGNHNGILATGQLRDSRSRVRRRKVLERHVQRDRRRESMVSRVCNGHDSRCAGPVSRRPYLV